MISDLNSVLSINLDPLSIWTQSRLGIIIEIFIYFDFQLIFIVVEENIYTPIKTDVKFVKWTEV